MAKPKPPKPKAKAPCPKGDGHRLKFPAKDDNGTITHECKKCGTKWTKPKGGKK